MTERMRIDASGNVLLNGASASALSNFSGSATGQVIQGAVPAFALVDDGDTTNFRTYLGNSNGAAYLINVHASSPFIFGTADTERARITAGGYFKASNDGTYRGATATSHEFNNSVSNNATLVVNATSTAFTNTAFVVFANRNTTDGTFSAISYYNDAAAAVKFNVADSGNVTNTNNSYGSISDEKVKQDIVDAASQWDDIKGVRVRKFRYKNNPAGPLQIGVVAQELETVSRGLIDEAPDYEEREVETEVEKTRPVLDADGAPMLDEDGAPLTETYTETETRTERVALGTVTKSVKYSVLYMKAIGALQEAMARIESLEARLDALEN
jgi:hypothetical protein